MLVVFIDLYPCFRMLPPVYAYLYHFMLLSPRMRGFPYLRAHVRIVKIISSYVAATGSKLNGIRTRCKICAITAAQNR